MDELQRPDLAHFLISTESRTKSTSPLIYDLDEEIHRIYDIFRPTILLVRPDGHIAVRVNLWNVILLRDYLNAWLPDGTQIFAIKNHETELIF